MTQADEHTVQLRGASFERGVGRRCQQRQVARDDERVRKLAQCAQRRIERASEVVAVFVARAACDVQRHG
ncbi:MAG TPA: hypothetical protein VH762_10600 [Gemmatimonadaceae bacterium]